jgi:type III secretion protein T
VDFFPAMPRFEWLYDYLIAMGFVMARMTGLSMVMPGLSGLTAILRGGVAFTFALPLLPMTVAALAGQDLPPVKIAALLPKEVVIGMIIGLVMGLPIWAAQAAGDMLDLQRGASAASLFGSSAPAEATITGTLLRLVTLTLYFGSGGLPLTLRTIYESYRIWPVVNAMPTLGPATGEFFLALLDNIVVMGLLLVAPIAIVMLLTDLLLGLMSRAAPTLNVFALSLSTKNLVFTLLMVLYSAFLLKYIGNDLSLLLHAGSDIEKLAKP